MDRRRIRGLPRRTTAGVAALVAAALGITLLGPEWGGTGPANTPRPARSGEPLDEDAAVAKARHSGKRVEVTALRSISSTTYALPDGSFELTAHGAPIRAQVDGVWKPIDTTLRRTAHGWAPEATVDPVTFSSGDGKPTRGSGGRASGPTSARHAVHTVSRTGRGDVSTVADDNVQYTDLATFSSQGHQVTLQWPGTLPAPAIDGDRALYRNVFPDVDLVLTARDSGFSHVLVVHTPEAAAGAELATLRYRLTSPDLTFHLDPVTRVVTAKDKAGNETAVSPTPYMWDSAGTPAETQGDDPQPVEPPPSVPSPSYSEEPGEPPAPAPTDGPGEDTAAPEPVEPDQSTQPSEPGPAASADPAPSPTDPVDSPSGDSTAQQSAYRAGSTTAGSGVRHAAAFARTGASAVTDAQVFALPALASPRLGAHTAVGDAALAGHGSSEATLTVTPNRAMLTGDETVWPLFIDPSLTGKTHNWTTVYEKYPNSSFYDGANYNSGTNEARVGYEASTWGLSRSLFRLGWSSSFKGAIVTSAEIRVLETYSWSCSAREMEVWHTDGISASHTWNNQPKWRTKLDSKSFAHGYNSSCPDAYVTFDGKAMAQVAADTGATSVNIGLKALDESKTSSGAYSWKKFRAEGEAAPKIIINYNRRPLVPTGLTMTPGPDCDTTSPYGSVGKSDLTFAASGADHDGDLKYLHFEVWIDGTATKIVDSHRTPLSTGYADVTILGSKFANGKTYGWRVRSIDSSGAASAYAPAGALCRFVYDSSRPNAPEVSSAEFPRSDQNGENWSTVPFGQTGQFTFSPGGSTDVVQFQYSFNTNTYSKSVSVAAGKSATVSLAPPVSGANVLYARSVDSAGNASEGEKYLFYVTPRDTADAPGDMAGDGRPDLFMINPSGDLRLFSSTKAGDLHTSLPGAHADGTNLETLDGYAGYWTGEDGSPALITHNGDFLPGDGIQDLLARMPDGKLYLYRGDGYGSVDIEQRLAVELPSGAPAPSTYTQVLAVGDINKDRRPDVFVTSGSELWALLGYTGGSFTSATKLSSTGWDQRDLVNVGDVNQDGAVDLVYRDFTDSRLLLRLGKPDAVTGTSLTSLGSAAASLNGTDAQYGTGWSTTNIRLMMGTPDVTGDRIPDIWAIASDGTIRFYTCTSTSGGSAVTVTGGGWSSTKAFG